jgi:hypothetical protein
VKVNGRSQLCLQSLLLSEEIKTYVEAVGLN